MAKNRPAFLDNPGAVNPMGGDTRQGPIPRPDTTKPTAPGGRWFSQQELPVRAVPSKPMTTGGFRPSPSKTPLPPPGSNQGFPKPPKR